MNKLEKLEPEAAQEVDGEVQSDDDDGAIPIAPVPADAPPPKFFHAEFGDASATWAYHDEQGRLVGYTMRFDYTDENGDPARAYRPLAWCITPTGPEWRKRAFPTPRPLYRLPEILERPDATVLICEGERTADAAQLLLPDMVATTSAFGAQKAEKTNWSALVGRSVIIAPDHDEHGEAFCEAVTDQLFAAGVTDVRILQSEQLGRTIWFEGQRLARDKVPKGWDLADALDDGWTAATLAQAIAQPGLLQPAPRPLLLDERGHALFRMTEAGVEARIHVKEKSKIVGHGWTWFCGPLELVALTRDELGSRWGKLFKLTDPDGRTVEVLLSDEWLAGDGALYREKLHRHGLTIGASKQERELLHKYLSRIDGSARATQADRMGWHGSCFVTGERVIGADDRLGRIVFDAQGNARVGHQSGTLEGWQEGVARLAAGNTRLALAISCAFAAMLMKPVGAESGGFHLVGNSSIGKTTTLTAAGSVWGGGGAGYARSWRATANGLEGIAAAHCDALLCLDEMGQVKSWEAGAAAYMLANGVGKVRASRTGEARPPKEWRTIVLSTGEINLADKITEDGRQHHATAGQQARFVDIPAAPSGHATLVENLHGHATSADFVKALQAAARAHYGHAWIPFARHVADNFDEIPADVQARIAAFLAEALPSGAVDGQVRRVAERFGLLAAAGEIAIAIGILPWPTGEARRAAVVCFKDWLDARGGTEPYEVRAVVEQVRLFLEQHGEARFILLERVGRSNELLFGKDEPELRDAESEDKKKVAPVRNCAGYRYRDKDGSDVFCVFPEVFRQEVCRGLNPREAARVLAEKGMLNRGKDRLERQRRVPGSRLPRRFFEINETIFDHSPEIENDAPEDTAHDAARDQLARLRGGVSPEMKAKLAALKHRPGGRDR